MSPEARAARAERMKALNADPEFNPLAGLSAHQRKIYRKLQPIVGRDEALREARKLL